jgi:hypothetical protein
MDPKTFAEQLLFSTVRVEVETKAGKGTGTGFMLNYEDNGKTYPFLITNKHVASSTEKTTLTFTRGKDGKPILGLGATVCCPQDCKLNWFGHPNAKIDVAVAPLVPLLSIFASIGIQIFYRGIPNNLIPSKEQIAELDAVEEITFLGYPIGLWDDYNLTPIFRRGITATPLMLDFKGEPQFLIDAAVFPGSSGSPVFILNSGGYTSRKGFIVGSRLYLLGIIASGYFNPELNEITTIPAPTADKSVAISKQMINLGIVFKSSTIIETVELFLRGIGELKK